MKRQITLSIVTFLAISPALNGTPDAPVVITKTGKIQGERKFYNGCCMDVYYGIPYAKPPVGDLRFKTTVPVEKWDDTLNATKKPPACPQVPFDVDSLDKESVQSEDCLYLNIWTPCSKGEKAVMVWIHGGNFTQGSASMSIYDGSELASKGNVVFVGLNYRLGILGFATSNTEDAPGNAGMYDQVEAMKWIHDNIGRFRGNSSCITLFGESAGSISVSVHAVSPMAIGLFNRVIMQSGSSAVLLISFTPIANLNTTDAIAKAVGCSSLVNDIVKQPDVVMECMRNKDFKLLINNSVPYQFAPQYGDSFLPNDPRLETISGKSKNCNRIVGVTADEGSLLLATKFINTYGRYGEKVQHPTLDKNKARVMMREVLLGFAIPPPYLELIIEYYLNKVQGDDNEEVLQQAYASIGDSLLLCPSVFEADKVAQQGNKIYYYVFGHKHTYVNASEWMGVTHFSEVPFVFGAPLRQSEYKFTKEEKDLSRRMIKMWTNFAKTGSPNSNERTWPVYSEKQPFYGILNTTKCFKIGQGFHRDNCEVFRTLYGFQLESDVTSLLKPKVTKDIPS